MAKFTPPTLTRKWVRVVKGLAPTFKSLAVLEDNGDGTFTKWGYSIWGPLGMSGTLKSSVEVAPLKTRADFAEAEQLEKLLSKNGWAAEMLLTAHGIKA